MKKVLVCNSAEEALSVFMALRKKQMDLISSCTED